MKKIIGFSIIFILVSMINCIYVQADIKVQDRNIEILQVNNQSETNSQGNDDTSDEVNDEISAETNKFYKYITEEKNKYELIADMDIKEYVEDLMKNGQGDLDTKKIIRIIFLYIARESTFVLKMMLTLFVISILGSLISNMQSTFEKEIVNTAVDFAFKGIAFVVLLNCMQVSISVTKGAIGAMTGFMYSIVPLMLMLVASVGGITQASVMNPIMVGIINLSSIVVKEFFVPIILMVFLLKFIERLTKGHSLSRLAKLLDKTVDVTQKYILTLGVFLITIKGLVGGAFDDFTIQSAKLAVDTFVPIVGKSLSDAVTTVASYSLQLKAAIGSVGLFIVIAIVLLPLVKVLLIAFGLKITAALVEPFSTNDYELCDIVEDTGNSIMKLVACLVIVSFMFFILITILLASGRIL